MYVRGAVVVAVVATRHGKHSDGEVVWHLYLTSCRARVDVDVAHLREGDIIVSKKSTSIPCESDACGGSMVMSSVSVCVVVVVVAQVVAEPSSRQARRWRGGMAYLTSCGARSDIESTDRDKGILRNP